MRRGLKKVDRISKSPAVAPFECYHNRPSSNDIDLAGSYSSFRLPDSDIFLTQLVQHSRRSLKLEVQTRGKW